MDGKDLAEFKDGILRLIVDKEHGADNRWLYHQVKFDGLTSEYLTEILKEIESFSRSGKLITLTFGETLHIQRTPHTKSFLGEGGFVKEWKLQRETAQEINHNALRGQRIEELQEKELKQKIKNNKYTLPIAIGSLIISLAALAWSVFKPSDNVSQQEYIKRVEQLEYNQKQLEDGLQMKNKELQEKLYKAELWIDVLEKDSLRVG